MEQRRGPFRVGQVYPGKASDFGGFWRAGRLKEGQALASEPVLAAEAEGGPEHGPAGAGGTGAGGDSQTGPGEGNLRQYGTGKKDPRAVNLFAIVLPEMHRDLYPILVKGFDRGAAELDYQVMVCNTDNDIHKQGNLIYS